jgi:hypothetical protein
MLIVGRGGSSPALVSTRELIRLSAVSVEVAWTATPTLEALAREQHALAVSLRRANANVRHLIAFAVRRSCRSAAISATGGGRSFRPGLLGRRWQR